MILIVKILRGNSELMFFIIEVDFSKINTADSVKTRLQGPDPQNAFKKLQFLGAMGIWAV